MGTTPQRIRKVATRLFAERGYDGTSIRALCKAAGVNLNAIGYHFGGEQSLYNAVLQGSGEQRLASAQRILGTPPRDRAELETRLILFAEETLATWFEEPGILIILLAEFQQGSRNCSADAIKGLMEQNAVLVAFLEGAAKAGLLREGMDIDIVAGALLERLNNQVLYADPIHTHCGRSVKAPEYRRHWVRQTIELLLYGAVSPQT